MKPKEYCTFLESKLQWGDRQGFDPGELSTHLFDYQSYLIDWSLRQGRSAIFADCGLGKSPMALEWARKVVERTNRPVLFVTPIAVGQQIQAEAEKFGVESTRSRDGQCDYTPTVWITNYEQLHKFDPSRFAGVVCDESSSIKDFKSKRKAVVVEFMRTIQYRLMTTATAAPNDYHELGTTSEALGLLGYRDMITTFFKEQEKTGNESKLGWGRTKYRFRGHAQGPFWSWVCSWARSCRRPSDIGFDDSKLVLPELIERSHVIDASIPREGMLFAMPAQNLQEEREERRQTMQARCEYAASVANNHDGHSVVWCNLNDEGKLLTRLVNDAVEVSGSMRDEQKEDALVAFTRGQIKRLVIKPKIGAWGLNWQHCHNVVAFPTHSFEQYYQLVRRCYRFGQLHPVTVSLVLSEGEIAVLDNLQRKQRQCELMFNNIVAHMHNAMHLLTKDHYPMEEVLPSWL